MIIGIDEAGRSPSFGPLVVAAIKATPEQLKSIPVDDSKKLLPKTRQRLLAYIRQFPHTICFIWPPEIDQAVLKHQLNLLTVHKFAEVAKTLLPALEIHADLVTPKAKSISILEKILSTKIRMEKDMESKSKVVAAASILATQYRYNWVKAQRYKGIRIRTGELGDPYVLKYAKGHPDSSLIRWTWRNMIKVRSQDLF